MNVVECVLFLSQKGCRGNILGIASSLVVLHRRGWSAICSLAMTYVSAEASFCSRCPCPCSPCQPSLRFVNIFLLVGWKDVVAWTHGEAKSGSPSAVKRSWPGHIPSNTINQVTGISLISYWGEQPEKLHSRSWPRKFGRGPALCGHQASMGRFLCFAVTNVIFIFIHTHFACQV